MQPKVYTKNEHSIDQRLIDLDALYVVEKLRKAGYIAYLVGGSVRDLLMNHTPKDYDISTSAKPEEIKRLFSNCLLIGRRFRLAHIRFGKKIIEVATFRSGENSNSDLILRDNVWGTPEEDVLRRDFTINGLFYEPSEEIVIDYVGGWEDLSKRLLQTIGDPEHRFKQDPVRMIRLLKFKARFHFQTDPLTWEAMSKCRHEIHKSSPARVLEEFFKMLESGSSSAFFQCLFECGFLQLLFPSLDQFMHTEQGTQIYRYLEAADRLILTNKTEVPSRAVLACSLLFPPLQVAIDHHCQISETPPHFGQIVEHTHELLRDLVSQSFSMFPRKIRATMDYILHVQYRLTPLCSKRPHRMRIVRHPDFSLALQFLQLRALAYPELSESFIFWKKISKHKRKSKPKNDELEPIESQ